MKDHERLTVPINSVILFAQVKFDLVKIHFDVKTNYVKLKCNEHASLKSSSSTVITLISYNEILKSRFGINNFSEGIAPNCNRHFACLLGLTNKRNFAGSSPAVWCLWGS